MTLLQLQYFTTLARVLHYTRAAEELHIAQPSLSYSIRELERELEVKLFEKDARKVTLTPAGERFLPYAHQSLELLDRGREALRQMTAGQQQVVRMGYFQSVADSLVPAVVQGLYAQADARTIQFRFEESSSRSIFDQLRQGSIDLAICTYQEPWAQAVPVLRQPLYLAVARDHPLAERTGVDLGDILDQPFILLDHQSSLRTQTDQLFRAHGAIPHIAFQVRECNVALQYVALNFGVAIMPRVSAMDSGLVTAIPLSDQGRELVRTAYLLWNKETVLSPAVQRVRDYIIGNFAIE